MSEIEDLTKQLASSTVEEPEKIVTFAGQALSLDTEQDASAIVKAINDCPHMTTLVLKGNTVGVPAAKAIGKALENQSSFRKALWKDIFTRRDVTEIPQALNHLSHGIMTANARLVVLNLSGNAFGPRALVGLQKLLESPSCYTLQELYLNNNGLGITGAKLISQYLCNGLQNSIKDGTPLRLKKFKCGRNRLENDGAIAISKFLKQLNSLEYIKIIQNGIYHVGIKALSEAFLANPKLKTMNLEDNSLTEKGAAHIAGILPYLPELETLNLGDCLLRTKGAISVASALETSCPRLQTIKLGFNEIKVEGGEAIVEAMLKKADLKVLDLNGNHFGDDGCELMKSRMAEIGKIEQLVEMDDDEGDSCDEEDDDENYEEDEDEGESETDEDGDTSRDADNSSHKSPLHRSPMLRTTTPADFLSNPTSYGLISLSNSNENFSTSLPAEPKACDYIDIFFKISKAVGLGDEPAKAAACKYADDFLAKAYKVAAAGTQKFDDDFLIGIGLLKGEDRKVPENTDISGALVVLSHAVKQPYFQKSTKDLLMFFMGRPFERVRADNKAKHILMQALFQV